MKKSRFPRILRRAGLASNALEAGSEHVVREERAAGWGHAVRGLGSRSWILGRWNEKSLALCGSVLGFKCQECGFFPRGKGAQMTDSNICKERWPSSMASAITAVKQVSYWLTIKALAAFYSYHIRKQISISKSSLFNKAVKTALRNKTNIRSSKRTTRPSKTVGIIHMYPLENVIGLILADYWMEYVV